MASIAALLFIGAGATFTPVTGACSTPTSGVAQSEGTCTGTTTGNFNAAVVGVNSLAECAQYVKESCLEKAAFVSFFKANDQTRDYMRATGDCMWAGDTHCDCVKSEVGSCKTIAGEGNQYTSGEISLILASPTADSNAIPPVRATDDQSATVQDMSEDPAFTNDQAAQALKDPEDPEATELMTISTAEELDMKQLRKDPSKIMAAAMKSGEIEDGCPEDKVQALHRGEWQCLERQSQNFGIIGGICGGGLGTALIVMAMINHYGSKLRKGDKDLDGEEEEEDE